MKKIFLFAIILFSFCGKDENPEIIDPYFFSTEIDKRLPKVITMSVTEYTRYSVDILCMLESTGESPITEIGICWSYENNPTTDNNKYIDPELSTDFGVRISNLAPKSVLYIRAFATNKFGTAYGIQFKYRTPN